MQKWLTAETCSISFVKSFWNVFGMFRNFETGIFKKGSPWTQDINWTYIRRSEDVLDLHRIKLRPVSRILLLETRPRKRQYTFPVDMGPKFNLHQTFSMSYERLIYTHFTMKKEQKKENILTEIQFKLCVPNVILIILPLWKYFSNSNYYC